MERAASAAAWGGGEEGEKGSCTDAAAARTRKRSGSASIPTSSNGGHVPQHRSHVDGDEQFNDFWRALTTAAAIEVQRVVRGLQARARVAHIRQKEEYKGKAVIIIQAAARRKSAKSEALARASAGEVLKRWWRGELEERTQSRSALIIQRYHVVCWAERRL